MWFAFHFAHQIIKKLHHPVEDELQILICSVAYPTHTHIYYLKVNREPHMVAHNCCWDFKKPQTCHNISKHKKPTGS